MTVTSASRASRSDGGCVIDIGSPSGESPYPRPARQSNRNGTALFRY
jgi:hypothetical protein